jgi:hypothetical protein
MAAAAMGFTPFNPSYGLSHDLFEAFLKQQIAQQLNGLPSCHALNERALV